MSKREKKVPAYLRHEGNRSLRTGPPPVLIVLSFKDYDRGNQGQTMADWENLGLWAEASDKLAGLCQHTIGQALQKKLITYYPGGMPSHSKFEHPNHLPSDVKWCSMVVKGQPRVIGHIVENIFYIVFLDKDHDFWPTKKKNT